MTLCAACPAAARAAWGAKLAAGGAAAAAAAGCRGVLRPPPPLLLLLALVLVLVLVLACLEPCCGSSGPDPAPAPAGGCARRGVQVRRMAASGKPLPPLLPLLLLLLLVADAVPCLPAGACGRRHACTAHAGGRPGMPARSVQHSSMPWVMWMTGRPADMLTG
jgi:hypothetical protein